MAKMDNENNIQNMPKEERDMLLMDTKKYTDELEELEKLQESISNSDDSTKEKDSSDINNEDYDIQSNRKKSKKKDRVINRKLGYHRRYLKSSVKFSNVILLFIFIVLSIMVICKFAVPEKTPTSTSGSNVVATSDAKFGSNIEMETKSVFEDSTLTVDITIKNNEDITIKFNPASIKLDNGENIYIPHLSDADKEAVPVGGLASGATASFKLTYNIDEGSLNNSNLETIIVGNSDTCILITSLGL